ncbi:MAG: 50S ribosomal protein L9 [Gemmatimonadales bacterium]
MEVILRQTVDNVGLAGELVKVKNGYARNYLIPRGLAYAATPANRRRMEAEASRFTQQRETERAEADNLAEKLSGVSVEFVVKAGEGEKLFGSITSADIASSLAEKGFNVDKRSVALPEPIKMIGIYKVPIRLHPDVRPEIRVWVVKEESD